MSTGLFGGIPIWVVFASTILGFAFSGWIGHRLGTRFRAQAGELETKDLGATLGGLLGLLGLLLAFTFGMAGDRFDRRKTLVLEEANAIGTAWLRTDFLPEPQRTQARAVFRAYAQARVDAVDPARRDAAIARSEKLQVELWGITAAGALASPTPPTALYVAAVNEVIDMHARRITAALRNPIPPTIFAALYAVAILTLFVTGYARGLAGDPSRTANFILTLVLSVVFVLILDLDRPYEGMLTVSQQAMKDVLTTMGGPPPP